jgi:glyoxylase-like metal-dependent hydrolase (beta-lactamase superfamily II)
VSTIDLPGWTRLTHQPPVFVREYSFGPGRATSVAVLLPGARWLLISPPGDLSAGEREDFRRAGEVEALLANNGAHYLGLDPWSAAFPSAAGYASERAAARIRAKAKGALPLRPLAELTPQLGAEVTLIEMAGDKIGDVLVRIDTERGPVLYVSDMVANFRELPPNPLFRLLFRLFDAAPGLKVFTPFFTFFVKDKAAAKACLVRELLDHPPRVLVPAHGDVVDRPELARELIALLRG